jgi:hypothetical protein
VRQDDERRVYLVVIELTYAECVSGAAGGGNTPQKPPARPMPDEEPPASYFTAGSVCVRPPWALAGASCAGTR